MPLTAQFLRQKRAIDEHGPTRRGNSGHGINARIVRPRRPSLNLGGVAELHDAVLVDRWAVRHAPRFGGRVGFLGRRHPHPCRVRAGRRHRPEQFIRC